MGSVTRTLARPNAAPTALAPPPCGRRDQDRQPGQEERRGAGRGIEQHDQARVDAPQQREQDHDRQAGRQACAVLDHPRPQLAQDDLGAPESRVVSRAVSVLRSFSSTMLPATAAGTSRTVKETWQNATTPTAELAKTAICRIESSPRLFRRRAAPKCSNSTASSEKAKRQRRRYVPPPRRGQQLPAQNRTGPHDRVGLLCFDNCRCFVIRQLSQAIGKTTIAAIRAPWGPQGIDTGG